LNTGEHDHHRESPMRRGLPGGRVMWLARYTRPDGARAYWKPDWNGGRATFALRREAQRAIEEAYAYHERYGLSAPETLGEYFASWTARHPRAERTNATNRHRIERVLEIEVEGKVLRDWPLRELRRRHALAVVDHLLRVQGRARNGAVNILRSLSALAEDAITDEVAEVNFIKGVRVRATDPRVRRPPRPARLFTFAQMHAFAAAGAPQVRRRHGLPAHDYQPLIRCFCDTGMRLGEVLPLRRSDLQASTGVFEIRRTSHESQVQQGTKTDHGEPIAGRLAPCPPTLLQLLQRAPARIDSELLFPTPTGRLWRERNFYRDVWYPAQEASALDIRPHEMRHSWLTHLRAAGVDEADLADMAGHSVQTMLSRYIHPRRESFEQVRRLIG
jgi:integrase